MNSELNPIHQSINDQFPVYSIFIFILILASGGALSHIFPCNAVTIIENNVFLKHFIGLLNMTFFVVLLVPIPNKNLSNILSKSVLMYIVFILISKTETCFFIPIIVLLGIIYLLILKKVEYREAIEKLKSNESDKKIINAKIDTVVLINNSILLVIAILIIIGFSLYLGRKKYEYGKKFNYSTFLLSSNVCSKTAPTIGFKQSLQHIFD